VMEAQIRTQSGGAIGSSRHGEHALEAGRLGLEAPGDDPQVLGPRQNSVVEVVIAHRDLVGLGGLRRPRRLFNDAGRRKQIRFRAQALPVLFECKLELPFRAHTGEAKRRRRNNLHT
jgi:hypothetical protein